MRSGQRINAKHHVVDLNGDAFVRRKTRTLHKSGEGMRHPKIQSTSKPGPPTLFRLLKRINSTHRDGFCLGVEGAEDSYFLSGIGFDEFRFIQSVDFVLNLEHKSAAPILDAI